MKKPTKADLINEILIKSKKLGKHAKKPSPKDYAHLNKQNKDGLEFILNVINSRLDMLRIEKYINKLERSIALPD